VAPQEEEEELTLIYQSKGVAVEQARAIARQIVRGDAQAAVDALAREELGIDPKELGGSAWVAAGTSFSMFAIGALVPLIPFAFTNYFPAAYFLHKSETGLALPAVAGLATPLVALMAGWPTAVSSGAIAIALLLAIAVGLVFGAYPARVAARLTPCEALRQE